MIGRLTAAAAIAVGALGVAGCGSDKEEAVTGNVPVLLTDAQCSPNALSAPPGNVRFKVTNLDSTKVDEFYIYKGDKVLKEVEGVTKGLSKNMTVKLDPGTYKITCPNATTPDGTLTVATATTPLPTTTTTK